MLGLRKNPINRTRFIFLVLLIIHSVGGIFKGEILEIGNPNKSGQSFEQKIEAGSQKVQEQDLSNDQLKQLNKMLSDLVLSRSQMYHEAVDVFEAYSLIGLVLLIVFVFSGNKDKKTNKAHQGTSP